MVGFYQKTKYQPIADLLIISYLGNFVIFPDFDGNLSFLEMSCTWQYMQFGQSACMFHISHGFQCRQDRRYIADPILQPLRRV